MSKLMNKFQVGYTVFKVGNTPKTLVSDKPYTVAAGPFNGYYSLLEFADPVHEGMLEAIAARAARREQARTEVIPMDKEVKKTAMETLVKPIKPKKQTTEHTGGSSSYYDVEVDVELVGTTRKQVKPALVSCNLIIEALNMNYAQATVFKAVWRICASKLGRKKRGNNTVYDAEKINYFAQRILIQESSK